MGQSISLHRAGWSAVERSVCGQLMHTVCMFFCGRIRRRGVSSVASVAQCGSSPDGEELPVDP